MVWITLGGVIHCNPVEWFVNVWFGLFHLFISETSASHTPKSSSELELHLSSVNRGVDICDELELESCDPCKVLLPVSSLVVHKIYFTTLGNVARVYPWIVQGLTFLSA